MDALKNPLAKTLPAVVATGVGNAIQLLGKGLPASVVSVVSSGIVVVKFEVDSGDFTLPHVTVPVQGSEYVRLPIKPGCKGVVRASDVKIGGVTGLGTGAPSLNSPGNLTALVFEPVGNTDWTTVDLSTLVLYGEPGVKVQNKTGTSTLIVADDGIHLAFGGHTIDITNSGVLIDGVDFMNHFHTLVQPGSGDSGPVGG